jgi:hypothetical protein
MSDTPVTSTPATTAPVMSPIVEALLERAPKDEGFNRDALWINLEVAMNELKNDTENKRIYYSITFLAAMRYSGALRQAMIAADRNALDAIFERSRTILNGLMASKAHPQTATVVQAMRNCSFKNGENDVAF